MKIEDKVFEDFFYLFQWPEEINNSMKDSVRVISQQEARFMENLDVEKTQF